MKFQATKAGVRVFTDSGIMIGEARSSGQPLSSERALAQLGFRVDDSGQPVPMLAAERLATLRGETDGS